MLKRVFDVVASAAGLVLLCPVMAAIAVAVRIGSPGSALFAQTRVGRDGRLFEILKFRTMYANPAAPTRGITVGRDPRITRVGAVLRAYKLDELPQLVNVLRGDMSLVGPRPELPAYVALYPPDVRDVVLSVRPGITDPTSINLRDESELLGAAADPDRFYVEELLPRKIQAQAAYVRSRSLADDLRLIGRTIVSIARQRRPPG